MKYVYALAVTFLSKNTHAMVFIGFYLLSNIIFCAVEEIKEEIRKNK